MPDNNDVTFSMGSSAYADRVPRRLKFFYAIGASAETIFGVAFNAFNFFFYTNIMGIPGTLAGLAITIALFFDAISDPLIGAWSDRQRSDQAPISGSLIASKKSAMVMASPASVPGIPIMLV